MIDYKLLDDSIKYYESVGYIRIESPWMVSEFADNMTKPKGIPSLKIDVNQKCLVASGEQSFLELYLKKYLPMGRFQTTTPCWRFEKRDLQHCKNFMKNELIKTDIVNEVELDKTVQEALFFFKQYIPDCEVVKTDIGYDIEIDGYELGSYGIRSGNFLNWIYATGCAEPRFYV